MIILRYNHGIMNKYEVSARFIGKKYSIVDVYDQIFSLEGGIYDRCINYNRYEKSHRINEIKKQIHQISREIAIWMFENESENACISQEEYKKICISVMQESKHGNEKINQDFLIGNFFKLVKHCEGIETEKLYFVHRSIYEYFVAETIYNSIEDAMLSLTAESQEELAGNIAFYLKEGEITYTIGSYLESKIIKLYSKLEDKKKKGFYQWWEDTVDKMLDVGMFYYTNRNIQDYKNIIQKETQCFMNLIKILRLLLETSKKRYIMESVDEKLIKKYIKYCCVEYRYDMDGKWRRVDLSTMFLSNVDLSGVNLSNVDLSGANLTEADLRGAHLMKTKLNKANLKRAKLDKSILIDVKMKFANLFEAQLNEANLMGINLSKSILCETNLNKTNLGNVKLIEADLGNADLRGANLRGKYIGTVYLGGTIFDEEQIKYLEQKYSLQGTRVFIEKTNEIISYEEYCNRKNKYCVL